MAKIFWQKDQNGQKDIGHFGHFSKFCHICLFEHYPILILSIQFHFCLWYFNHFGSFVFIVIIAILVDLANLAIFVDLTILEFSFSYIFVNMVFSDFLVFLDILTILTFWPFIFWSFWISFNFGLYVSGYLEILFNLASLVTLFSVAVLTIFDFFFHHF